MRVFRSIFSALVVIVLGWQNTSAQNLEKRIRKNLVQCDDSLAYAGTDFRYSSLVPAVQMAQWKDGYVMAYVTTERRSRVFFTDKDFKKTSEEIKIDNRIIFQLVTENNELALLTGDRGANDADNISKHIYFTKISETGEILIDQKILGSDRVKRPKQTELDNWGNFLMNWTGSHYVAFFPIQHNFSRVGPPDVHQGDCTYFINPDGTLYSYSDWGSSHSFEQRMVVGDQFIVQAAKGDAYPRGLAVDFISTTAEEPYLLEKDEKDQNNAQISYEYQCSDEFSSTAFKVSGQSGANYVPFSLGDIVTLSNRSAAISCSYRDRRKLHDIVWVKVSAQRKDAATKLRFITQTPTIAEHSVRMVGLSDNRILLCWKQFDATKSRLALTKLSRQYEEYDDEDLRIFMNHNQDIHKMAIVDSLGSFVTAPQTIKNVCWYYTSSLMESSALWFDIVDVCSNNTYSGFTKRSGPSVSWTYHRHKSMEFEVYTYLDSGKN